MEIIRDLDWCPVLDHGSVVTVGEYDGVHRGHRTVISEMHRLAAERGCATAVVTFDRHPATVVRPESAPKLLCDLNHKLELLAETGVDYTLVVTFDEAQAAVPAEEFAHRILVNCLSARAVVVGADFHFGKGRRGNIETLRQVGTTYGYEVVGLPLVRQMTGDGDLISSHVDPRSTRGGRCGACAPAAGSPLRSARGRHGWRPARSPDRCADSQSAHYARPADPADGVYAAWYVRPDGAQYPAAVNIGRRPTFYEFAERSLIEAHLIGFRGDLYDETARLRFVRRLRPERRFDGIDELKAQLRRDIEDAAKCLHS